MKITAL
jgi:hypothetical protein